MSTLVCVFLGNKPQPAATLSRFIPTLQQEFAHNKWTCFFIVSAGGASDKITLLESEEKEGEIIFLAQFVALYAVRGCS